MSTPTNHWKLGLFVVVGFSLALATVAILGARALQSKQTVSYKSYFDESVQGLEVGSPAKFRGVTVGNVSNISVAPDHRHVEVTSELGVDELDNLGLNPRKGEAAGLRIPPELRIQLGSQGITGVKFILIDFFPVKDNPVPELPFPTPPNYIPSARSTMKNLEDAVVRAVDRFPEVADQVVLVLGRLSRILEELEGRHLPDKAATTFANLDLVLGDVRRVLRGVDVSKLSTEGQKTLANIDATTTQVGKLVDRLQGDKGLVASAERATNAVGDIAKNATGAGGELEETLRDVQEAAEAVQRLGAALDRDGDMLLKGRSKPRK